MWRSLLLSIFLTIFLLTACGEKQAEQKQGLKINPEKLDEELIQVNRRLKSQEMYLIQRYITRRNWNMMQTGTGVHIMWLEKGKGDKPQSREWVRIAFQITLLDGSECYSSSESGDEWFKVDYDQVESGMHEAIKYLSTGDRAIIIIPSFRAFGLAGDMDKIPGNHTVVYDLTLNEIRK
jgi:FKBP-type peptidyl-prolyl cis-trans isomerase FkpA